MQLTCVKLDDEAVPHYQGTSVIFVCVCVCVRATLDASPNYSLPYFHKDFIFTHVRMCVVMGTFAGIPGGHQGASDSPCS